MQVPSLSRVFEQQLRFPGPCNSTSHRSGECAVSERTSGFLRPAKRSISACSCSTDAFGDDLDPSARTWQRLWSRKSFLFTGNSGALTKSIRLSTELPLPVEGSHGGQTKAGWRPATTSGKETGHRLTTVNLEKCLDAVKKVTSRLLIDENKRISVRLPAQQQKVGNAENQRGGSIFTALTVSLIVLTAPGPTLTNSSVTLTDAARADQLGQLKQAASMVEKGIEALPKVRFDGTSGLQVLDKAVTIVTGSTFVDPKFLDEEVNALLSGKLPQRAMSAEREGRTTILSRGRGERSPLGMQQGKEGLERRKVRAGEKVTVEPVQKVPVGRNAQSPKKDIQEEVQNALKHTGENLSSTVVDVITNFNPGALSESAGASISAFLETGAERLAAFELSALVSLGERWLILTPLLVLPMAWEMNRVNKKNERELREGQEKFQQLSGEAALRGEKVRRELERIELRTSLLDAVSSLGKAALEPPRSREQAGLIRRRISDILERLEDLKPVEDPLLMVPEFASVVAKSATPGDALSYVPTSPTVDGDWGLIYVSETAEGSGPQEVPQFPGFGLENLRQKVWQAGSISSLTYDNNIPSPSPLLARNTAEFRLGPLGVFQVAVEGSWENLKDGQRALVSFNTFSARPVEVLGNKLSDDVPGLNLSLPPAFQRTADWAVAYVDEHLRINRGSRGQLFVFRKMELVPNVSKAQ